jgi:hypothetical protein
VRKEDIVTMIKAAIDQRYELFNSAKKAGKIKTQ